MATTINNPAAILINIHNKPYQINTAETAGMIQTTVDNGYLYVAKVSGNGTLSPYVKFCKATLNGGGYDIAAALNLQD